MPKHTATLQEAMPHLRALYRVLFTENEAARRLHRATKAAEARLAEPKSRTR